MARNLQQNEQARETRMEQIRGEALRQFALKGLVATRIQDIAKGVGMAQGLIYHYYSSKEAIYIDLVKNALDKITEASLSVKTMHASGQEKIEFALRELFQTIEASESFAQTCCLIAQMTEVIAPGEETALIEKTRNAPYQIVADIMRQGQSEGNVVDGDPEALSLLFWSTVNGLAIYRVSHSCVNTMPDYKLMIRMFIKPVDEKKEGKIYDKNH